NRGPGLEAVAEGRTLSPAPGTAELLQKPKKPGASLEVVGEDHALSPSIAGLPQNRGPGLEAVTEGGTLSPGAAGLLQKPSLELRASVGNHRPSPDAAGLLQASPASTSEDSAPPPVGARLRRAIS